jgi:hypothetical protein
MTPERAAGLKLANYRLKPDTGYFLTREQIEAVCQELCDSEAEHAAKDAEIQRLREALAYIYDNGRNPSSDADIARNALAPGFATIRDFRRVAEGMASATSSVSRNGNQAGPWSERQPVCQHQPGVPDSVL